MSHKLIGVNWGGVQSATQSDAPNYLTTLKDLVDQDPQFKSILHPLIRSNDATVSPQLTMNSVPPVQGPQTSHAQMILGGCNPRVVQKVLKKSERKLQRCISKKVKANVESIGQISLAWSVDGRGKPRNLRVSKSILKNDNIAGCLQKGLQDLSFPKLGAVKCMVRQKIRVLPK